MVAWSETASLAFPVARNDRIWGTRPTCIRGGAAEDTMGVMALGKGITQGRGPFPMGAFLPSPCTDPRTILTDMGLTDETMILLRLSPIAATE